MSWNRFALLTAVAAGFMSSAVSVQAANILTNPGFEDPVVSGNGNHVGTSATGWSQDQGQQNLVREPGGGQGGSDQFLDLTSNGGPGDPSGTYVYQSFTLLTATKVDFGGWYSPRDGGTGGGDAQIYDSTNTTLLYTTSYVSATGTNSPWVNSDLTTSAVLPAGTYVYRSTFDDGANTDSDYIIPVPEPASLALLGFGGLGLLSRRRQS